jgi:hypothetical protein
VRTCCRSEVAAEHLHDALVDTQQVPTVAAGLAGIGGPTFQLNVLADKSHPLGLHASFAEIKADRRQKLLSHKALGLASPSKSSVQPPAAVSPPLSTPEPALATPDSLAPTYDAHASTELAPGSRPAPDVADASSAATSLPAAPDQDGDNATLAAATPVARPTLAATSERLRDAAQAGDRPSIWDSRNDAVMSLWCAWRSFPMLCVLPHRLQDLTV